MMDWATIASILLTLAVLLLIRRWTARQTRLRGGLILFAIGLPAFLTARAVGVSSTVQSPAFIWPMILLPLAILTLSLALLVRGGVGVIRNHLQRRRLGRNTHS